VKIDVLARLSALIVPCNVFRNADCRDVVDCFGAYRGDANSVRFRHPRILAREKTAKIGSDQLPSIDMRAGNWSAIQR
jgi:hypothetical protein